MTNHDFLFIFMTLLAIVGWVCACYMQQKCYRLQAKLRSATGSPRMQQTLALVEAMTGKYEAYGDYAYAIGEAKRIEHGL